MDTTIDTVYLLGNVANCYTMMSPLPAQKNATIDFNIGVAKDRCVGDYYSLLVKDK